jgi:hypothetical protein
MTLSIKTFSIKTLTILKHFMMIFITTHSKMTFSITIYSIIDLITRPSMKAFSPKHFNTQHNDTQPNNIQHTETQYNGFIVTFSIAAFGIMTPGIVN